MKFFNSTVIVVFLGLFAMGSATRCYLCSGLLTDNCASGVHESDIFFKMHECDGKCIKMAIPAKLTLEKDTTTKMCAPFIRSEGVDLGNLGPGHSSFSLDQCQDTDYCYVCDGDLCNAADKIPGVSLSVVLTLSILLLFMH